MEFKKNKYKAVFVWGIWVFVFVFVFFTKLVQFESILHLYSESWQVPKIVREVEVQNNFSPNQKCKIASNVMIISQEIVSNCTAW